MVQIEPYIGTYYSRDYVKRKILRQTDEEILEMEQEMEEENATGVGVPLETQNAIMQGQIENGQIGNNQNGASGKVPTDPNDGDAPLLDIKKAKI